MSAQHKPSCGGAQADAIKESFACVDEPKWAGGHAGTLTGMKVRGDEGRQACGMPFLR